MNWYNLSRKRFDFSFDNPENVNCNHTALYFYILDKWNRLWQKEKFWLPSLYTMEALGIKSKNTFYKTFNDLTDFWFIKIIQKSKNQNTSNIISLTFASSKNKSALDSATIQQEYRTCVSGGNIDKQINKETNKEQFELFWKEFPHARKWKKANSKKYFDTNDCEQVMQEVRLLNWKIKLWIENWKFIPACERWIRDFTQISDIVKEQNKKDIVYKIMIEKWDKRKEYAMDFEKDFWKDVLKRYSKERNKEKNWITLNLNK